MKKIYFFVVIAFLVTSCNQEILFSNADFYNLYKPDLNDKFSYVKNSTDTINIYCGVLINSLDKKRKNYYEFIDAYYYEVEGKGNEIGIISYHLINKIYSVNFFDTNCNEILETLPFIIVNNDTIKNVSVLINPLDELEKVYVNKLGVLKVEKGSTKYELIISNLKK